VEEPIDDEDTFDFTPPPGPSKREIWKGWAEAGDVDALWDLLSRSRWCDIDREDVFKLLVQALEVRSKADPARFASEVMGRMTVFVTTLLMRSHLHLAACVEQDGRAVRRRAQPPGDLPRLAIEVLIPRVVQLQEHLASLLVAQSSIARQWSLVRKNESKGDRVEADEPRKAAGKRRARSATDRPSASRTNGHANNRVADLLNGHGRGNNGVRDGM